MSVCLVSVTPTYIQVLYHNDHVHLIECIDLELNACMVCSKNALCLFSSPFEKCLSTSNQAGMTATSYFDVIPWTRGLSSDDPPQGGWSKEWLESCLHGHIAHTMQLCCLPNITCTITPQCVYNYMMPIWHRTILHPPRIGGWAAVSTRWAAGIV